MRVKIPGFRPGKAPLSMIEKKYGQQVESDVLEKVVSQYYAEAIKEANVHPVTRPAFEKTDFKRKNPLGMTFTVEVMPEIKDLNYKGLLIKDEEVAVTEDELESMLTRTKAEHVKYDSQERPVEENDLVTVDYDIVEENIKREGQVIKVGSEQFPAEFSDQLKGKSKGSDFEAAVTFPDSHPSEFKGKRLTFRGTIKDIKVLSVPEMDDDFAKTLGYENVDALEEAVRNEMRAAKKRHVKKKQIAALIEKLVESHDFPVPESMLEAELSPLLTSAKAKEENKQKADEIVREELLPEARKNAKAAILLNVIGEKENVTVSEEDMKAKIFELSQATLIPPQNLVQMYMTRDGSLEGLRYAVFKEKVAELLHAKAGIEKGE
jgi:trigger factor